MNVCVLGSGVVGLTSAYYLAKKGIQVTVVDRQEGPALETSFANAGQISPGYSAPWAAPGIPLKAAKWLLQKHTPLRVNFAPSAEKYKWIANMLGQCTEKAYNVNKSRMMTLAEYSRDQFIELRKSIGIQYDDRQLGTLQLFRTQQQVDAAQKDIKVLTSLGVKHALLTAKECTDIETGLHPVVEKLAGGLRLPGDETGDCYQFCQKLKAECDALGVTFRFEESVQSLNTERGRFKSITTDKETLKFDKVLVCLGSYSTKMMADLDIKIPVYPVKGYSLTVPIQDEAFAPVSTVMDETYKVAVTRLGGRIRAAGTAEIDDFNMDLPKSRTDTIRHVVGDLFGRSCDLSEAEYWTGLRPMTHDGTPIIGATHIPGLYLNTGHGTLGWTMACGSGRVIADLMNGTATDIETTELSLNRYQ
ncbi:D-amino acid dehydrogenase [Marinomonas mediterranea]|uniref:D-amino-acid dehydrogenase n=1 Tax=Marinomonas mediterranea (strain ATCC 700492 / JCM 21426 / NBRC 103028 / MMB-1) TaxID=717774 RepID=F2JZH9_MARM1|nr:D-amino acid dehydrogenase [Marinomonas mediterranea]ADZ89762.1 D-amino-acid dehydrogenase [Marinomonas mediterranea MMB-1]WCN07853.1 FAD-dependent oxidoreductase [Marinomonas mediterranea]WCN11948.1 FAD-dependent oxidoreductase [Marinomonas mediterranea]WCN15986.1 FAD-dependent oxidoreductase [Marinomonas mediterranea MMB-1]